ncbi:phytoene desaturase family protein [Niallia endozanthoxylica]|uniref:phytoene desaturase family protein n=1 Tax=Niallia endozanthoxylica TaxID=2036016 RepID=UPI00168B1530|nr:NAD(P)/FAD-dependent oxidoreductase [Niallia endozanthoxylica]
MEKTVCVIGAGIGGLTAGAYLAKHGYRVTVLEKAATVGGSAGWYVRKNRLFPTGATLAFGLEEHGLLRNMLNELDIDLPATELLHPMDVVLPGKTISIYKDSLDWEAELKKTFPEHSQNVLNFWRNLTKIGESVLAFTETRTALPIETFSGLADILRFVFHHPFSLMRLARFSSYTVEDFMRKYRLEQVTPFRQMLNVQLIDAVQTDVSEAALLPASLALTIYRRGSFSIQNGIGEISKRLADRIEGLGGEILLNSPVGSVSYNKMEKQWEVQSPKCKASFDIIVNNTGVLFGYDPSKAQNRNPDWGAFRLDAVLKEDICRGPLRGKKLPFAYQIVPKSEHSKILREEAGPLYVTFHPSLNKNGETVAGEVMMTASIHTNPKEWILCTKEEYKNKKEKVKNAILSEIEKMMPLKEYVIDAEAGTPLTYQRYIGKAYVGGTSLTVKHAVLKPKSVRSSLPQFYIAGEQVFPGPGTLSSALSGYYASMAVMEDVKKHDYHSR